MDAEKITEAMQYGSKNPGDKRENNDLGRFGLGLKTASLSQCRKLTVVSKRAEQKDHYECRQWDFDYVQLTGEWSLKILEEREYSQLPQFAELQRLTSGTLVVWQQLEKK